MKLLGDPVPRAPELDRFVIRGNGDERPVVGRGGMEPAGIAFVSGPGLHWIGYQSFASPLTLDANRRFRLQHRYDGAGTFNVTVKVVDKDGEVGIATFLVTVRPG